MGRRSHRNILAGLLAWYLPRVSGFTGLLQHRAQRPFIYPSKIFSANDEAPSLGTNKNSQGTSSSSNSRASNQRGEGKATRKVSRSRNKAISALSQPLSGPQVQNDNGDQTTVHSKNDDSKSKAMSKLAKPKRQEIDLSPSAISNRKISDDNSVFSLLPPTEPDMLENTPKETSTLNRKSTLESTIGTSKSKTQAKDFNDEISQHTQTGRNKSGQTGAKVPSNINLKGKSSTGRSNKPPLEQKDESKTEANMASKSGDDSLPSIADLFPPDFSSRSANKWQNRKFKDDTDDVEKKDESPPTLDGVLPVSDLFYRSSQPTTDEGKKDFIEKAERVHISGEADLSGKRIHLPHESFRSSKGAGRGRGSSKPRKLVRRGMEMLVGGVPINADPPRRYVDLVYSHKEAEKLNWGEAITMNTRDFGPMWHNPSLASVSRFEKGLFCEHFVHYTSKWGICPKDLRSIKREFLSENENPEEADAGSAFPDTAGDDSLQDNKDSLDTHSKSNTPTLQGFGHIKSYSIKIPIAGDRDLNVEANLGGEITFAIGVSREDLEAGDTPSEIPVFERILAQGLVSCSKVTEFSITFTKLILTELDNGTTKVFGDFRLVLNDIEFMTPDEIESKACKINSSLVKAMDEGDMQLSLAAAARKENGWAKSIRDRIVEEFLFEDDDEGLSWEGNETEASVNSDIKDVEDVEEEAMDILDYLNLEAAQKEEKTDGPFGMPGTTDFDKSDIFLGGGNDGVFWHHARENSENAPYKGELGLRLVDAVTERAKERQPRVIAIGDVHGCIDELQELLRRCDYRPGDLVCFLGDLVSKGPDSISVVQMAREIGAIGVRGNHDFEVIRWHQAIKSGVNPRYTGSEHFHIASCLSKADMKWMYSLPWYISSRELGTLFVHAGFVSGIRLAKQNPRLMMNMRSILPDGTVTSKFFNNWPWARLWDGPQTVLFGHDADRGLQQYEHAIGLDTGCVYGGRLTACILPEKRLVSVGARREYFKYRRKHYD